MCYSFSNRHLILLSGDIETNPGPDQPCPCEQETDEKTIRCDNCEIIWHESCIGLKGMTPKALEKISIVHCMMCIAIPKISEKIANKTERGGNDCANILESMKKMEKNIIETINKDKKSVPSNVTPFKEAAIKNLNRKVEETNRLVKVQMRNEKSTEEEKEKQNRTKVVRKPININITNSRVLRKEFNKCFENVILKEARISAGGSFILEFEDLAEAKRVQKNWKNEYLGGNSGMVDAGERNCTGLVKFVDDDLTEKDIEENIKENYPGARHELFKKGGEFLGLIKVTFKDENELEEVIANKFTLGRRKYLVEKFQHKPRVIKCNICQAFGHIALRCRNKKKPNCGKCGEAGHESLNCIEEEENHQCYHCKTKDHKTGSYKCKKVQEILEVISQNKHDG